MQATLSSTSARRYLESSSFKMALLFTVLLSASAAILGYLLLDFGKRHFLRETEAAIDIEISVLISLEKTQGQLAPYIQRRAKDDPVVHFRYEDAQGKFLAGTIDPMPAQVEKFTEGVLRLELDRNAHAQTFAAKIHTFYDGSRMIIARDVHELTANHQRLQHLSALIVSLMLAVVLVSFSISLFVVSRINRIGSIAQHIVNTGDLSQRLAIDSHWDDLSNLAQVLNGLLNKIETLMNDLRVASHNIAHDLRTPLSGLRNDVESFKGQPVDDTQIDALLANIDRILAIFQALLRISHIEKGKHSNDWVDVNLKKVLHDVAELYEPVAEEKEIRLQVETAARVEVRGDPDLLFQLFANIIDNAIKFSPNGSTIRLYTRVKDNKIVAYVEDQGPGIAEVEKDKIFELFYRGDTSRSTPGHGLGLSLVRAIAEQHRCKILLENVTPGLRVGFTFPAYESFRIQ